MNFIRKTFYTLRKFGCIYFPVAEALGIIVSLTEPSVIHNKQFNAGVCCPLCQF